MFACGDARDNVRATLQCNNMASIHRDFGTSEESPDGFYRAAGAEEAQPEHRFADPLASLSTLRASATLVPHTVGRIKHVDIVLHAVQIGPIRPAIPRCIMCNCIVCIVCIMCNCIVFGLKSGGRPRL